MLTQNWQPPNPQPPPPRSPAFRGSNGKFWLLVGGVTIAGLIGLSALGSSDDAPATPSSENGNFYVSAGWTTSRLADLSVKMQRDDGVSQATAHCAMKNIAAVMTWLEWQAEGTSGQFALIRAAETGC